MALNSRDASTVLLTGPPACAKTLFLQCLMKLKGSHFIDFVFKNKPKYLLLDELDKLSRKDQAFLLNLMEIGIVSEIKYNRTRMMKINTTVFFFATSNNVDNIIEPLSLGSSLSSSNPIRMNSFIESY
jgi:Cdc6-like AAA superfamily ATPase